MPRLGELYAHYQKDGLEVIGICLETDERKELIEKVLKKTECNWPTWLMGGKDYKSGIIQEWRQRYSITGVPMTWLIGRDGKLITINPNHDMLEQTLREALDKARL